ncbi:HNH endonuclease [Marinobacter salarius]|uniref:HNH endonuclease n=1 Tax=Marinobacter salarius TaxID=1420917 RepID=UPI003D9C0403
MIPDGIEKNHLDQAVAEIRRNGVPENRKSIHYDYVHSGWLFPPKYIISIAAKYAFGEELESGKFNAVRARDYLRARGHTVIDRREDKAELVQNEDDESAFAEGAERYRRHRSRERDPAIARKVKEKRLAEEGVLACDVCGFDFADKYGELGLGFIEAHHTVPVAELDGKTKTKASDFALVCSNCHRMLHRQKKVISIEALREQINQ